MFRKGQRKKDYRTSVTVGRVAITVSERMIAAEEKVGRRNGRRHKRGREKERDTHRYVCMCVYIYIYLYIYKQTIEGEEKKKEKER